MPDLYAELGVDRTADEAAIRQGYRQRAKQTHPDAGGSPKAFERTRTALAVLTDPKRRKQYDETGEWEELKPDTALTDLMDMLDRLLSYCVEKPGVERKPTTVNYRTEMLLLIHEGRRDAEQGIVDIRKRMERYQALLDRFTMRQTEAAGKLGFNPFQRLLQAKVTLFEQALVKARKTLEDFKRAEAIVESMDFRIEVDLAPFGFPDPYGLNATRAHEMQQRAYEHWLQQMAGYQNARRR